MAHTLRALDKDPYEVVSQVRSASLSNESLAAPSAALRAAHVRIARVDLEQRGRASFLAERWATQPVAARARVVWRAWAQTFARTLQWENAPGGEMTPRMRERLDELTTLLSGPATRGELRVLEAYESYFQVLFTLGWALVKREGPEEVSAAATDAWRMLTAAWVSPWVGRRRHQELSETLLRVLEPAALTEASS